MIDFYTASEGVDKPSAQEYITGVDTDGSVRTLMIILSWGIILREE